MGYLKPLCGLFTTTIYKCTIKKMAENQRIKIAPYGSDEMNQFCQKVKVM